jgi:hypothetical protein
MSDDKQDEIIEHRKYVRIPRRYIVHCSPFTAKDLLSPGRDNITEGLLKNISCGGVLFESRVQYNVGILLRIELALPGWERFKTEFFKEGSTPLSDPLTVLAHVVRLEVLEGGMFDIGACFAAIDEGDKWTLFKYIQRYAR